MFRVFRQQVKMQWVDEPNQSNVDNLNIVRREASKHFRNRKKTKIEDLETKRKVQNIRDLYRGNSDFKKGYQPRTNIVWDEKCDFFADSHLVLDRWRSYFSQLLNIHEANDVRQTKIHAAGPPVL
jgi:hypothetical protein